MRMMYEQVSPLLRSRIEVKLQIWLATDCANDPVKYTPVEKKE